MVLLTSKLAVFGAEASSYGHCHSCRRVTGKFLKLKIPEVDTNLQGQSSGEKLRTVWKSVKTNGHFQLLKATFRAYGWAYLSAVPPRLALSCFTFAQPFLITATIDYIGNPSISESKMYGQGLIGAYVLVYVGLAVGADWTVREKELAMLTVRKRSSERYTGAKHTVFSP